MIPNECTTRTTLIFQAREKQILKESSCPSFPLVPGTVPDTSCNHGPTWKVGPLKRTMKSEYRIPTSWGHHVFFFWLGKCRHTVFVQDFRGICFCYTGARTLLLVGAPGIATNGARTLRTGLLAVLPGRSILTIVYYTSVVMHIIYYWRLIWTPGETWPDGPMGPINEQVMCNIKPRLTVTDMHPKKRLGPLEVVF